MADSELLSPVRRSAAQSRALACGKAAGLTRQMRYLRPRRQARAQRRLPGGALACELSLASRLPRWHRRAYPTSRSGHCRSCLVPVLGHSWSGPPHAGTLARHPAGTIVQPDGGTVAFEIAPVLLPGFRPGRPRHGASHLAYRRAHAWAIGGRMGSAKARDQVGRSFRTAWACPRQQLARCAPWTRRGGGRHEPLLHRSPGPPACAGGFPARPHRELRTRTEEHTAEIQSTPYILFPLLPFTKK